VDVYPVARRVAHLDVVSDALSAKFPIPYCVAPCTGAAPRTADFAPVDGERAVALG